MNPLDDQLGRLFRAARSAPATASPPFGLETRVVAAWRAAGPGLSWDGGVLTRGLILAGFVMGISLCTVLAQKSNPDADYLQLADSTVQADYP